MNVLLLRPDPGNERFGLGPFFRVEPLGLEYVGAALRRSGHAVRVVDLRMARSFRGSPEPDVVGLSCMHALEYDQALDLARRVKRRHPRALVVMGGHAAAAHPAPLENDAVDVICLGDGELVLPMLADALARGESASSVPGLRLRREGEWITTAPAEPMSSLDAVPLPARDLVAGYRRHYHCLLFRPVWLVETARGCPFRCDFCSVWQLHDRSFRERSIGHVADDMEQAGEHVFIVDDLFWHHASRSLELANELKRRGVRKRWILVQTRTDLVMRHPDLLAAWRPLAQDFDIFFGLEAASDEKLSRVTKDSEAGASVEAARIARALRYGVTGNFLVDPDWAEDDFRELWDFVDRHDFHRAGYTILTPLPGTSLFDRLAERLAGQPWFKYDMHHVLWEPKLGARRFFELYAETWKRSILNLGGRKSLSDWLEQVRIRDMAYIARVMLRTQRMMRPEAYLREHRAALAGVGGRDRAALARSS